MSDSENSAPRAITVAIAEVLRSGSPAALVTLMAGAAAVGSKLLVSDGAIVEGSLGDAKLNNTVLNQASSFLESRHETQTGEVEGVTVLFERIQNEPRVVICGAGHVGASLARLASQLGYRPVLIDDRPEFVIRKDFPDGRIELVLADTWADAVAKAVGSGRGVYVSIVTRGHSEDEQCLRAVLSNSDPNYVGLIGSRRRTRIVLQRLRDAGVEEGKLARVHAPIGLDIGAVTPEEVALAILAEIVARRRGGSGGSLSSARR